MQHICNRMHDIASFIFEDLIEVVLDRKVRDIMCRILSIWTQIKVWEVINKGFYWSIRIVGDRSELAKYCQILFTICLVLP